MKMNIRWSLVGLVACASLFGLALSQAEMTGVDPDKARKLLQELTAQVDHKTRVSPSRLIKSDGGTAPDTRKDRSTPEDFQELCEWDEQDYLGIEKAVIHPWANAWKAKDSARFLSLTTDKFSLPTLDQRTGKTETFGKLSRMSWSEETLNSSTTGKQATETLSKFLGEFASISDLELTTTEYRAEKEMRNPQDFSMRQAELLVRFDIRGTSRQSVRREDRGMFRVRVSQADSSWKIAGISLISAETLLNKTPSFSEITEKSGVTAVPPYLRTEAIRRGGYALSMTDFDGDGNVDLVVGTVKQMYFFKGDGKGSFTQITGPSVPKDSLVKTALFADLTGSGNRDLLLTRFSATEKPEMRQDVLLYRNQGKGQFSKDSSIVNMNKTDFAMPAAIADFNGDGYLDLYVGFPGARDFTTLGREASRIPNAAVELVYLNDGKGKLVAQPIGGARKDVTRLNDYQRLFPHAAMALDYNNDGKMDLIVVDDRGNISPIYENHGNAKFTQVSVPSGLTNSAWGMGTAAADIDGDGLVDLVMTNVNLNAGSRIMKSCKTNWDLAYAPQGTNFSSDKGVRVFKNLGNGKFAEITEATGITWAGEGLAGAEFIDYNNDGLPDLYIANGLWSGTDREQDMSSLFARATSYSKTWTWQTLRESRTESQSVPMKILAGFIGDLSAPNATEKTSRPSMGGFQHNRLFRNLGNGKFAEVAYLEGVDSIADGYVVATSDLDKDGRMDLVLRNADPGTSANTFSPVQIFHNESAEGNHGLSLRLIGAAPNTDAIGAKVTVTLASGQKLIRQLISNNGSAQSELLLSFGLGKERSAQSVAIRWPSGRIQTLEKVPAGERTIHEKAPIVSTNGLPALRN